ncbi:MAG: hypothetical protein OEM38_00205 [Gammaproteobacteria bacterium]|nr:hypothetical protein [Gammaproteobacteria bacterium]
MKKQLYSLTANRQDGQFIVNLAEILVSAGLVIGAAFQAQVFVQNYQFESYYDDLKAVETVLWDYKGVTGRWPGDCNADGVIDIGVVKNAAKNVSGGSCAFDLGSEDAIMRVLSDLASANMLDDNLRAEFANEGKPRIQLAHDMHYGAQAQNVLVAFDVSVELAEWLDNKIDGGLASNEGRVRLWGPNLNQEWPKLEESTQVSIAYYFDTKI